MSNTVEPRFNEGPVPNWQNLFAVTRPIRYIKVLFHIYFAITGVKKIVRYIKDFVIQRFVIDRRSTVTDGDVEVLLKGFHQ